MVSCAYEKDGSGCYLHKQSCEKCKDRLSIDDPEFSKKWVDPLLVTDRNQKPVECLRDMLAGTSVFLACGGPSANDVALEQLNGRGTWTLAINNMAAHHRFRPQAFLFSDPPSKFSSSIWLDPGIMKFAPIPKLRGRRGGIRRKVDGKFEQLDVRTYQCPNVWGFQRDSWLWPDDRFFLTESACWGNHNAGVKKTGQPKTVCTMLLGLRLLRYLGARRVFLIGVDFRMSPDYGYAFGQERDSEAAHSNNAQFKVVNDWLVEMQRNGTFSRFGMEILNCNQFSSLRAFPYIPFDEAMIIGRGMVEEFPDTAGWYEK